MSASVLYALKIVQALSIDEQQELVEAVEEQWHDHDFGLDPEWIAEIRRRSAEYDAGLVQPIPWFEVRQSLVDELNNAK